MAVGHEARQQVRITCRPLATAEVKFLLQLLLLESEPVTDLSPAEGDLTSTVANIKDQRSMFGLDFTCDAKRTATRSRNRTTSFITARQSATGGQRGMRELTLTWR